MKRAGTAVLLAFAAAALTVPGMAVAKSVTYKGTAKNDPSVKVQFKLKDKRQVRGFKVRNFPQDCSSGGDVTTTTTITEPIPYKKRQRRFSFSETVMNVDPPFEISVEIAGRIKDKKGKRNQKATGTFRDTATSPINNCDSGTIAWKAKKKKG